MENTAVLNVRISEQLKQQLENLAKEKDETVSDYVRDLLSKHVLQDATAFGISPELMEKIKAEAKRRDLPTTELIARLVTAAFAKLRRDPNKNIFVIE